MSDALKYDFEGQQAIAGFCEVLPDESILFAATLQDKASRTKQITYHYENNAWFEMTGRQIQQLALAEQDTTRILAAEQTLTELIWEHSDETTDGDEPIAWLFDSQEIDWHSEKFKHLMDRTRRHSELNNSRQQTTFPTQRCHPNPPRPEIRRQINHSRQTHLGRRHRPRPRTSLYFC